MSNLVYTASKVLTINSQESFSLRLVAKTFRPNIKPYAKVRATQQVHRVEIAPRRRPWEVAGHVSDSRRQPVQFGQFHFKASIAHFGGGLVAWYPQ
jgi:hypothetical protein